MKTGTVISSAPLPFWHPNTSKTFFLYYFLLFVFKWHWSYIKWFCPALM